MRFGLNVLNFGGGAGAESLLEWTRLAESLRFHAVMISDHVAVTADVARQYPAPFYDPFVALAWLAPQTGLEIGTTVAIVPYRHPLHTARIAANIDRLSGGRFILGVGVGWARKEFDALGLPFEQRGAMANEYLHIIREFWTHDVVTHSGRFVSFDEVHTGPRPARSPHPPIWVGGSSAAALRRAASFGDAWHPIRSRAAWLRDEGLPGLRAAAGEAGRPVPALCPRLSLRITKQALGEEERTAGEGSIDQVRSDFEELAAMGARYILLDTYSGDTKNTRPGDRDRDVLSALTEKIIDPMSETIRAASESEQS